jgi:hypothetical protein
MIPMYSPETDQMIQVPAKDEALYRQGGYATGDKAQPAMTEEHLKIPIVALANAVNGAGIGFPKKLLTKYGPEYAKTLEHYEEEHPYVKTAATVAGGILPFLFGAGEVGAALKGAGTLAATAGHFAASGAMGGTAAYNEVTNEAKLHDTPLTREQIGTAVGLGGLLGVAGEVVPEAASWLSSKMNRGTAKFLENISKKSYFNKTVVDPITEAYRPNFASAETPTLKATVDSILKDGGGPLFKPEVPPPLPKTPTLGPEEFNFASEAPPPLDLSQPIPLSMPKGYNAVKEIDALKRLKLPKDTFPSKAPRLPTARQLGKQSVREMPMPELPSEQALADSAAQVGQPELPIGRLNNDPPAFTRYDFKEGQGPGVSLKHAASEAFHGRLNPASILAGHATGHSGLGYMHALPDLWHAVQKTAEINLLKHQAAVQGVVNFMTNAPARAVGVTAKALLQGNTGNISSSYLSGNLDDDYSAIEKGVSKLAANPEMINDYYQKRYGPLFAENPQVLAGVVQHQTKKVMHLADKLPKSTQPTSVIQTLYSPSRNEKVKFLAQYKAVNDPFNAAVDPTREVVEAIKATNPEMYNHLVSVLQGQIADPKIAKKLTRQQARQLSTLLGTNISIYDDNKYIGRLQQSAQAATANNPKMNGKPPGQAAKSINLGKQAQSFVSSSAPPSMQNELDDIGAS